ncbi:hypothetical protein MTP99_008376 [Tenebrio molitor]|nr:hypothetical protein MTP99_008376 [Tenebrio molitor]
MAVDTNPSSGIFAADFRSCQEANSDRDDFLLCCFLSRCAPTTFSLLLDRWHGTHVNKRTRFLDGTQFRSHHTHGVFDQAGPDLSPMDLLLSTPDHPLKNPLLT